MFAWFTLLSSGVLGAAIILGGPLLWATAVVLFVLLGLWLYQRHVVLRIPEMAVGVIFNRRQQSFARFLASGRHAINPFTEQYSHSIPTGTGSAGGHCLGAQTSGGIALDIEWTVNYDIDPFRIKASARPKLARNLPNKANTIVSKHLNNCLRHVVGEFTIDQICQPGAVKRLEQAVRQQLAARLAEAGFSFSRVMLGSIDMPTHVKLALEAAQQRAVETENEARSLARLQQVVSQFSESDMQRLMELERIHTLGQNGVTLLYPAAVGRGAHEVTPPREKMNGNRSESRTAVAKY